MPLEPMPIGIETSQTVPDEKMEEGSRLNSGEPNQETWRSPSSAVNLEGRGVVVLSMEILLLTCEIELQANARAGEMWKTRSCSSFRG
jgi:hypothetical protein